METINKINADVYAWAKSFGFNMPSNGRIADKLAEEAKKAGISNPKIECASEYYFPLLVA